jgi:hypothetical protein
MLAEMMYKARLTDGKRENTEGSKVERTLSEVGSRRDIPSEESTERFDC